MRTLLALLMLALPQLGCDREMPGRLPDSVSSAELRELLRSPNPVRAVGGWATAVDILTGERTRWGLSVEIVAAMLVEVAVSADSSGDRADAVAALIRSTQSDKVKPYAGAVDRLGEIYRRSTNVGIRAVALGGIARYSTPAKALAFLAPIAEQGEPRDAGHQFAAINLIAQLGTPNPWRSFEICTSVAPSRTRGRARRSRGTLQMVTARRRNVGARRAEPADDGDS